MITPNTSWRIAGSRPAAVEERHVAVRQVRRIEVREGDPGDDEDERDVRDADDHGGGHRLVERLAPQDPGVRQEEEEHPDLLGDAGRSPQDRCEPEQVDQQHDAVEERQRHRQADRAGPPEQLRHQAPEVGRPVAHAPVARDRLRLGADA